jgi:hypothetical protein
MAAQRRGREKGAGGPKLKGGPGGELRPRDVRQRWRGGAVRLRRGVGREMRGGNGLGAVVQGGRRAHDAPGSEGEARRCRVGHPRKETEWAEPG